MNDEERRRRQAPAVELLRNLATGSYPLSEMLREHKADNDEILPTLLLADMARWFVHGVEQRGENPTQFAQVKQLVNRLADAYLGATDGLENTIAVGFLEPILPFGEKSCPDYVHELPGPLRNQLMKMLNSTPQ